MSVVQPGYPDQQLPARVGADRARQRFIGSIVKHSSELDSSKAIGSNHRANASVLSQDSEYTTKHAGSPRTAIPIKDFSTRLFLLGQFVLHLESADQSNFAALNAAGLSVEALEVLRSLTLADTARFAAGQLGISIHIDCRELVRHLGRVERAMTDRQLYEALIRRGASVRLVAKLFGVSEVDVRRLRKLTAPESAAGGRPRLPDESVRVEVLRVWQQLAADNQLSDRLRWWELATCFPEHSVVSLESVVQGAK